MVSSYLLILCLHCAILFRGSTCGGDQKNSLKDKFHWNSLDYTWPSNEAKKKAVQQGTYDPNRIVLWDFDLYNPAKANYTKKAKSKFFVTTPKFQKGTPVTLSTISKQKASDGSYLLKPFPDWSTHDGNSCDDLTSVYQIQIDRCGKLWVLDSGLLDTIITLTPRKVCNPQIVVYDLNNDNKIILRYRFPQSQLKENSFLTSLTVDTRDSQCKKQYVYVADTLGFQLLVFDPNKKKSWTTECNFYNAFPVMADFNLNGYKFDLLFGIYSIALGPIINNDRTVYFHALATYKEVWIQASVLLDPSSFKNNINPTALFTLSDYRNSQSSIEVMDKNNGVMYFPLLASNSLACWNSNTTYKQDNFAILYQDSKTFPYLTGMKLDPQGNNDALYGVTLYCATAPIPQYVVTGKVDTSQVNFRVLYAPTDDLTQNTICDVSNTYD